MGVSFIRTIIIFILLIVSMRIMGKRQLGELEPIELIVAVLISNLASQPLQDVGTPLIYGIVPVLTLLCCQVLISYLTLKRSRIRQIICGRPSILIDNGKIIQSEMRRNRISIDELYVELRGKEITDIAKVKHAILETNGTLSVITYPDFAPLSPKDMGIATQDNGSPLCVIIDGRLMSENLLLLGKDRSWLMNELKKRGAGRVSDVYIMSVDKAGNIYFSIKDRKK